MAEKNNKTLLWVGLAGIAGVAVYEYWKNSQGVTTTNSSTSTPLGQSTSTVTPIGQSVPVPSNVASWYAGTSAAFQSAWNNFVNTQSASTVQTFYNTINSLIPYWNGQPNAPTALVNQMNAFWQQGNFPPA